MRIAYLFGSDAQSGVVAQGGRDVINAGSTDIRLLRTGDRNDFRRIHIPGNFKRARLRASLENIDVVLNLVTDPDQNPKVLESAVAFLKPFGGRVINHPKHVLQSSRDRMAASLSGIAGLHVPKVARFRGRANLALTAIERAGIAFPAILRLAGTHSGNSAVLVPDHAAVIALLQPDGIYLLTEFVEMRAAGGLYHKIRLFFLGDTAVVRHRLVSDRWSVHAADRARVLANDPHEIEQERRLVEGGVDTLPAPTRSALIEVRKRVPLDFFGIDFGLMPDGGALLFEANPTMNFFPISPDPRFFYAETAVERARHGFAEMLS